jgi:hypothetical protein
MMFKATFNFISVISWRSVLLVEETGASWENHRNVANRWQTLSHNALSSTTLVVIVTDSTGSCKSNYHAISTTMVLFLILIWANSSDPFWKDTTSIFSLIMLLQPIWWTRSHALVYNRTYMSCTSVKKTVKWYSDMPTCWETMFNVFITFFQCILKRKYAFYGWW